MQLDTKSKLYADMLWVYFLKRANDLYSQHHIPLIKANDVYHDKEQSIHFKLTNKSLSDKEHAKWSKIYFMRISNVLLKPSKEQNMNGEPLYKGTSRLGKNPLNLIE